MADLGLRPYQQEVVERALQGENVIIWLPTGAGKTRAAVYVAKRHLESRAQAKVAIIANRVHLVEQHFKECQLHLGHNYTLTPISGDSVEKDFFGKVVEDSHLVICTAQILYNAMISAEDLKHIDLSDISLLIIDECHHTNKESVYNQIMRCYVEKKLEGKRPLPQILGLTASPGAGGAKSLENAVNHVLQICANLDSAIVSSKTFALDLKKTVPRPTKTFDIVEKRPEDPFGDLLIVMMQKIHDYMIAPPDLALSVCGTQEYEAKVVILEQTGVKENNRVLAQCALHLRKYNDALLINDTLQMMDAYHSLEGFYIEKALSVIDDTDVFLIKLFRENRVPLKKLAENSRYENPKMAKLEDVLLKQFGSDMSSKAILFSKTCKSTHCLKDWIHNNTALQEAGIKASVMIGSSCMTQKERDVIISNFRQGTINLLVSTSVTEEGLDIPDCNLVVRYGLLTNEIAQLQASGRARAPNSQYSVVALKGGKEVRREHINEYLEDLSAKAIAQVQNMSTVDFHKKIASLQREAMLMRRTLENLRMTEKSRNAASSIQLLCRNCFEPVAFGSDIKLIENSLYVNVNPDFKRHYKVGAKVPLPKSFTDWEPGCTISCGNGNCNKDWGFEIKYKKIALLPNLAISNFALETSNGRVTKKKWKNVPFVVENFSFEQYCQDNFPDILD
ncbi:ATP-dependent RNA helicase DHX58 [Cynoglossus semilaevis]|uniref:RNA helicase n=1 Tax=Cynoglossus semilaevis TaxID=244447 RepID=A0A3P8X5I4_CYNSE|nr:probable ATP-dependent RNA helicase DHX58 [Cynoglossus semilaevis]XP_016896248.1 probable ATP-dependent RNA helicase DHX58 [Cynoglossus semilaevis]XP_024920614.1 probable ATP-dependent RNA helicase DHX58 [Cynoglossus semilaevis]